jgi:minor extracellular serine protease Vpr
MAKGSYYSNFDFNVLENSDGFYGIQTAVSAAAPLTAGVIALMLEVNPELTPSEIKTILQETAREDSFTGSTPNNEWGYGKLDALAAILEASGMSGTQTNMPSTQLKVYPNPAKNQVILNVAGDTWSVSLFSLDGKVVREYGVLRTQELDLTGLPSGIYLVRAQNGRQVLVSKVMKN